MKFATCLLIVAAAVVSVRADCPDACLDVLEPVTDENGVTYPNECYMQAAKCKGKKDDEDPLEEYKRIYGKSFGASRDVDESKTGNSASEAAKCKGPRENVLDEYKRVYGKSFGASRDIGDDDDKSKASKKCAGVCPDIVNPVCGSDGVKYSNPCELKVAACKHPDLAIVEDDSACSNVTTQDDRS
ncbi:putative kazal-type serine protease inhibitor [Phytophthora cinnamomi]|uniref:putative kazal-type serine protease inhibitor n=1 Tax=Phytophthora cinnamomi TaxID=4785 RepID=UPI00355A24C4|nr:putative kazal-type serine protease inhibitor [Phytophthora cinnamomi]